MNLWNKYNKFLNPKSLIIIWKYNHWYRIHENKKSNMKEYFHIETFFTLNKKRKVKFIYDKNILFIYDIKNISFIFIFAEWQIELKDLEKKIEKNENNQERFEELKENIRKKNIRFINKQILLIIQVIKYNIKINLINLF